MNLDILKRRIVLPLDRGRAQVERGLTYGTDGDPVLRLDVYRPRDLTPDERRPAVVFVHGGPIPPDLELQPKEWGSFVSYGELMASRGWVAVTFNHRFYGREHLETATADVREALRYVTDHAESLRIDPDRLAVWLFSGGGLFLSLWYEDGVPPVRALVGYYPLLDLAPFVLPGAQPRLSDKILNRYSPLRQFQRVAKLPAPLLLVRAGQDGQVLNDTIDSFTRNALSANTPLAVINHPTGQHGFDIMDDEPRSREIIALTVEFLAQRLGVAG